MQRWRVPLGFLCGALFILLARPGRVTLAVGGAIALIGLLLRGWSAGHIRKNAALATSGPYAHTRNPLYLGSFILGLGFTVASGQPLLGILFAALFLGIYLPVMRVEATTLAEIFGDDYRRYAAAVPLFLPRLVPYRDERTRGTGFDLSLYLRYREYQAALGLAVAWGLLALKAVFPDLTFAMYRSIRMLFPLLLLTCALALGSVPAKQRERADASAARMDASAVRPFEPGEELVYDGEYSRALLRGLNIAEFRFTSELTPSQVRASAATGLETARPRLFLKGEVISKGLLQKLFGVDIHQRIESTVEPDSFLVLQTTKLDRQGSRMRTSEAIFDHIAGKVVWTERDPNNPGREPRVITSAFKGQVQDIVSAIYFLRAQSLTPGKVVSLVISDSGKVYTVPVRVLEGRRIKTALGQVQTVRVDPELFGEGRLIAGRGSISIWLTDDARHIPVRAHINNELGTIDIKLKSVTTAKAVKAG